jgi:DNA mismatch endonuclease, patch repair protein
MDKLTPERRSANMAAIRGRDTKPEMTVRRFLHRRGLRYRLHKTNLPGSPDLIFSGRRTVIFVHGCFWHGCPHCGVGARQVKSNAAYWAAKVSRNKARDQHVEAVLGEMGWRVLIVWECETKDRGKLEALAAAVTTHLPSPKQSAAGVLRV